MAILELAKDEDPVWERRRIRQKTSVKKFFMTDDLGGMSLCGMSLEDVTQEQLEERRGYAERLKRTLLEEGFGVTADRDDVTEVCFGVIKTLKGELPAALEDVLRTRIVSLAEVQAEKQKWDEAIRPQMC